MQRVVLQLPAGERQIDESGLPVQLGSHASADIRFPGPADAPAVATIGLIDGKALLQVAGGGLLLNGAAASGTRWLNDGDVLEYSGVTVTVQAGADPDASLVLSADFTAVEYQTLPPGASPAAAAAPQGISPVRRRERSVGSDAEQSKTVRNTWLSLSGAGFAVLLLFALYIFTANSVGVATDPEEAEVDIGGFLPALSIDGRYLLWSGDYSVRIEAEGYYPLDEMLQVTGDGSQDFAFVLTKKPGKVRLLLPDVKSASISVDGSLLNVAPGEVFELEPGLHTLTVQAERYLQYTTELEVEGAGVLQELNLQLVPGWADVSLSSSPEGASVLVGGEVIGTTPGTLEIMAGTVALELRKPGYKTYRQSLLVAANQPQELPLIELREIEGLVNVRTQPTGAVITVDGVYQGVAPLTVELDKGASYTIRAQKPGFKEAQKKLAIKKSGEQSLSFDLIPLTGEVRLSVTPADAELLVDGKLLGQPNRTLVLPSVPHKIELRKAGYESFVTEVTPKPGLPQQIDVQLLTPEQALLAATPQVIQTSQGAEMRLIQPGQFTMGSPRREQGRRPNEVQRQVKLTRPFYIGAREVSNKEYREFYATHTSGAEKYRELSGDSRPAVMMSWDDAARFCNWLSDKDGLDRAYVAGGTGLVLADPPTNGYRMPTEAEWVWVARYAAGSNPQKYPWGNLMPPSAESGNYADSMAEGFVDNYLRGYNDGYPVTAPVGSFYPNSLGIYDLGGNVAEWVSDLYAIAPSQSGVIEEDPSGPLTGNYRVIRGSSWRHSSISELRWAYRDFGNKGRLDVGFRLARYTDAIADQ